MMTHAGSTACPPDLGPLVLDSLLRFATSQSNMKYHALLGFQGSRQVKRQVRTWVRIYFRVGPFFKTLWDLYIEYSNEPSFYLFFQSYTYKIYSHLRLIDPLLGQSLPVRVVGQNLCALRTTKQNRYFCLFVGQSI